MADTESGRIWNDEELACINKFMQEKGSSNSFFGGGAHRDSSFGSPFKSEYIPSIAIAAFDWRKDDVNRLMSYQLLKRD